MKIHFTLFALFIIGIATHTYAQCDMQIKYSVADFNSTVKGSLKIVDQIGNAVTLCNDETTATEKTHRLTSLGKYTMIAYFDSEEFGRDSVARSFTLTGDEKSVEVSLLFNIEDKNRYNKEEENIAAGHFIITKISKPSPLVMLKYIKNETSKKAYIVGPLFTIHNASQDTIYGQHMPGYFWGTLSEWKDGKFGSTIGGEIFTSWAYEAPLYPNKSKTASVGGTGVIVPKGRYMFNLYYSTERRTKGQTDLVGESNTIRWWCGTENWHVISHPFEVK